MPKFKTKSGEVIYVDPEDQGAMTAALRNPDLSPVDSSQEFAVEGALGGVSSETAGAARRAVGRGGRVLESEEVTERVTDDITRETFDTLEHEIAGAAESFASGATLGLSTAAARALGADPELIKARREANPFATGIAGAAGAIAPILLSGGAGAAGAAARALPTSLAARAATRIGGQGVVVRAGVEGALQGVGVGIDAQALSEDPLNVERAAATIGSSMLFGGAIGLGAGAAAKVAQRALQRGAQHIDEAAARGDDLVDDAGRLVDDTEDLSKLDRKGLKQAEKAEIERIKADQAARKEAIPERIGAYQDDARDAVEDVWEILKAADKGTPLRKLLRPLNMTHGASRGRVNKLTKNLIRLKERPQTALGALEESAQVVDDLAKQAPAIREALEQAGKLTPKASAKLDKLAKLADDNAALRQEIKAITSKPASSKLDRIAMAREELGTAAKESLLTKGAKAATLAGVTAATAPISWAAAPFIGKAASDFVGKLVGGGLSKATAAAAKRSSAAINKFVESAKIANKTTPVLATQVLGRAQFGPEKRGKKEKPNLEKDFLRIEKQIRSQVAATPAGPKMTMSAREGVAKNLGAIMALNPLMADRLEAHAARRIEFLASKLPARHGLGVPLGPDDWTPSRMDMREFARYVAAVEDPDGIVERMADGTMSIEDAEVLREVYPGIYEDIQRQIWQKLPELQHTLPYEKKLMLSILFDIPVEPTLDPTVLDRLQSNFTQQEPQGPGSGGQPQFERLQAENPTRAQARGA